MPSFVFFFSCNAAVSLLGWKLSSTSLTASAIDLHQYDHQVESAQFLAQDVLRALARKAVVSACISWTIPTKRLPLLPHVACTHYCVFISAATQRSESSLAQMEASPRCTAPI